MANDAAGILNDPTGDIAKVRGTGVSETAIMAYIVDLHKGHTKERAFRALLQGRDLTPEQRQFTGEVLDRLAASAGEAS